MEKTGKKGEALQPDRLDPRNRRYVGTKETVSYIAFDMSQSYNIDDKKETYITSIVQLDLRFKLIAQIVVQVWDVVNDLFTGAIVERTRTRWGKFKPYLMVLAIPGTVISVLYWLMPAFFSEGAQSTKKFLLYLTLEVLRETIGTFQGMAKMGIQATLTPYPKDRERLITVASFVSGILGEKLPSQVFDWVHDHMAVETPENLQKLYMGFGVFTVVIAGVGAFWFFCKCKERVVQTNDVPSIRRSISTVIHNRPILMLTLSEALNGMSIQTGKSDYLTHVLHENKFKTICGIPGFFINPISYSMVPWFHRHFSDKTLYILGKYNMEVLSLPVFLFGSIGGVKHGMYKKKIPMAIALTLYESAFMCFYGVRSVVPTEMMNECMDYCEWKNGYRGEAMIAVARSLATKTANILGTVFTDMLKIVFGFDQKALTEGRDQSDTMQYVLFSAWTVFSFLTKLPGIIPMLFYNIDPKTKETMYADLHARREAVAAQITLQDA